MTPAMAGSWLSGAHSGLAMVSRVGLEPTSPRPGRGLGALAAFKATAPAISPPGPSWTGAGATGQAQAAPTPSTRNDHPDETPMRELDAGADEQQALPTPAAARQRPRGECRSLATANFSEAGAVIAND